MARWTHKNIPSQKGKLAIVTGANSGIGYHTTRELILSGARVIMACRNAEKAAQAARGLRNQIPGAAIELLPLDLASLASVRAFATAFREQYGKLDLLINNAGIMAIPYRQTEDGFEMQFGTNHLGHFALTGLLLESLLAAPLGRVVTVSSMVHRNGKLDFENLDGKKRYTKWGAYAQSKLANLLFAYELQRKLDATGAGLISLGTNPGYADTNLQAVGPQMAGHKLAKTLTGFGGRLLAQRAEISALTSLYAATCYEARGGDYIEPSFFAFRGYPIRSQSSPASHDLALAARLWQVSEEKTGVKFAL